MHNGMIDEAFEMNTMKVYPTNVDLSNEVYFAIYMFEKILYKNQNQ